jgi:hypothetical protein
MLDTKMYELFRRGVANLFPPVHEHPQSVFFFISRKFTIYSTCGAISKYVVRKLTSECHSFKADLIDEILLLLAVVRDK